MLSKEHQCKREQHENIGVFCLYKDKDYLEWPTSCKAHSPRSQSLKILAADFLSASFHFSVTFSNFRTEIFQNC